MLVSPADGHKLRWREILRRVKFRLQRWSDGDIASLWSEALEEGRSLSRHSEQASSSSTSVSHNIRRAKRAVQEGQYSKAIKALTSNGLASPSPEILQEMLGKHPQAPPPSVPSGPTPASVTLNAWYIDDGTLVGSPEDLAVALRIVEEEGPALGLHVNHSKSLLFIPPDADASQSTLLSDIPIARRGFTLLGWTG